MRIIFTAFVILGLWGCGSQPAQQARELSPLERELAGAWKRPEPITLSGLILFRDGRASHWAEDFRVFHGRWWIEGEDTERPELHLSMGGAGDTAYEIARYNDLSLQLRGRGELGVILRRATLGELSGTAAFPEDLPDGAMLHVALERWGRLINNELSTDPEPLDRFRVLAEDSPAEFTLYYIEELRHASRYGVRAWVEDTDGNVVCRSGEPQVVNLRAPDASLQVELVRR